MKDPCFTIECWFLPYIIILSDVTRDCNTRFLVLNCNPCKSGSMPGVGCRGPDPGGALSWAEGNLGVHREIQEAPRRKQWPGW